VTSRVEGTRSWHASGAPGTGGLPHRRANADTVGRMGLTQRRTDVRRRLAERRQRKLGIEGLGGALAAEVEHRGAVVADLHGEIARLQAEIDDQRRALHVWTTMTWLEQHSVPEGPKVSVVLPTRDRRALLERAVESVLRQEYQRCELVVVVDGSRDSSMRFLEGIDDDRVQVAATHGVGVCAARNVALERATGDLVTYLDDDNVMHPLWLKAVVWAAHSHPEADVFYGARIFDSYDRAHGLGSGGTPWLHFLPWDRDRLEEHNIADMNVIAHRRRTGIRFDEELSEFGDWDLFLRLTEGRAPVEVPVVACGYTTDAPDRLSGSERQAEEIAAVRRKADDRRAWRRNGRATRVLAIALDAYDPEIALRLAREGRLPNLRRVLDRAARVEVNSPPAVFVSSLWPTIFTGVSPAEHQYVCWVEVEPDTYEDRWTELSDIRGEPFWDVLARAGRRVAIFDVPHTSPSEALDGIDQVQVLEWGAHDRHLGTRSVPEGLAGELARRFGAHPVGGVDPEAIQTFAPCDYLHRAGDHRSPAEARALLDDVLRGVERKEAASLHLLERGGWDLFLTVFGEGHCTGHQFWAAHDSEHPRHDPDIVRAVGDPVVAVYERLDAALGKHLAVVDDETTVLVFLSHGMGPHYGGTHLLDTVLHRIEVADAGGPQGGSATRALKWLWARSPDAAAQQMNRLAAAALRQRLRRGDPPTDQLPPRAARSWFQAHNNDPYGAIRLNVVGREPNGVIRPGAEFDDACEQLRRDLLALVNVETGEPAVLGVVRTDSIFERKPKDRLPDLFVDWDRRRPVEAVYSRRTGLVVQRDTHWRTGDHWPGGLLLATGPGVPEGATLAPADATDLAPTLCSLLDIELRDTTGHPIPEIAQALRRPTTTRPRSLSR